MSQVTFVKMSLTRNQYLKISKQKIKNKLYKKCLRKIQL